MEQSHDQAKGVSPLKELREKLGMSQQEFATKMRVSIGSVSRWERGNRQILLTLPQYQALTELVRAAEWNVDEFLARACQFEETIPTK